MQDLPSSIGSVVTVVTNTTTSVFYHYDAYTAGMGTVVAIVGISTNIFKNPRVAAAFAVLGAILTYVAVRLYEMGSFTAKIAELETVSSNLESTNQGLRETHEKNKEALNNLETKIQQFQKLQAELELLIANQKTETENLSIQAGKLGEEVNALDETKNALAIQKQELEKSISELKTVNKQAAQHSALIGTLLSDVKKNVAAMNSSGVQLDEASQKWIEDTQKQVELLNVLTQQSISSMKQEGADVMTSMKEFVNTLTKDSSEVTHKQLEVINSLRQEQDKIKQEIASALLENEKIKMAWEQIKADTEREKKENEEIKKTNQLLLQQQQKILEQMKNATDLNQQSAKTINNIVSKVELNISNNNSPKIKSQHRKSSSFSGTLDTLEIIVQS